jgi:hypothetical protein
MVFPLPCCQSSVAGHVVSTSGTPPQLVIMPFVDEVHQGISQCLKV